MTYEQYLKHCQALQRKYVRDEQKRMTRAEKLWMRYKRDMSAIGLHPLGPTEIENRRRELVRMFASVETSHGDSPAMRLLYGMQVSSSA
jgi:hypothetical protein